MNEIKEIIESFSNRIRSPFFAYVFFVSIFHNWKEFFFLFFATNTSVKDRITLFNDNTSWEWLILWPLVIGFLFAIISPWIRWFLVWIAEYPIRRRNIVQVRSQSHVLAEKNRLAEEILKSSSIEESDLIEKAKRDAEIAAIENEELREKLQKQIYELREESKNTLSVDGPDPDKLDEPDPEKSSEPGPEKPNGNEELFDFVVSLHKTKGGYEYQIANFTGREVEINFVEIKRTSILGVISEFVDRLDIPETTIKAHAAQILPAQKFNYREFRLVATINWSDAENRVFTTSVGVTKQF